MPKKILGKHMPKANSLSSKSFMVLTVFQIVPFYSNVILVLFYMTYTHSFQV